MAKSEDQKLKILYLAKILEEQTDEEKTISMEKIISSLEAYGIKAERKSIYADIEALKRFGYEIDLQRGKNGGYHLLSRKFEVSEVRLLIDAVQASKFITEKKSNSLIKKLEEMLSKNQASDIQHTVVMHQRIKSMNETVYYSVDTIHQAITEKKQISFLYYDWNMKKEKVYRHNGEKYCVSPIALTWDDENYYLLAQEKNEDIIKHFRIDKMEKIQILLQKSEYSENRFDTAKYSKKMFGMYGGEDTHVKMRVHESLTGVFFDRFGRDLIITPDGEYFTTIVEVAESPVFFGWVMQFGNKVQILSPQKVIDEMKRITAQISDLYN